MFHVRMKGLDLSTGAFSRSHANSRSVVVLGPCRIQHSGDIF